MPPLSVKIERIKLKDLPAVAAAAIHGAAPGTFIPITLHRAEAHTHNPNADPNDVALLLANEGERNVGYFGLMPVRLQHDGQLHKVYWLTTWAVSPDYLGKGLGSQLMEAALALDVDLAIVGSKPARRVSAKYGFHEVKPLDYLQIDLGIAGRYNPISLILRLLRKAFSLLRLRLRIENIDQVIARFFDIIFAPLLRPLFIQQLSAKFGATEQAIKIERVSHVQAAAQRKPQNTGFHRSVEVVNWMLTDPWVLPAGSSVSDKLDYGFSDSRLGFELSSWQVASPTGLELGFVCFQSSRVQGRVVLKVLDHQFSPAAPLGLLLGVALKHAARIRADVIEGPAELAAPLRGWLARLLVVRKQRTLQVHPRSADSPLGRAWPSLEQSYVDGDMAFT